LTLLLSHNVNPRIVSERLSFSSLSITLHAYSHVLPTMQESFSTGWVVFGTNFKDNPLLTSKDAVRESLCR
jgi:hypothetical protein